MGTPVSPPAFLSMFRSPVKSAVFLKDLLSTKDCLHELPYNLGSWIPLHSEYCTFQYSMGRSKIQDCHVDVWINLGSSPDPILNILFRAKCSRRGGFSIFNMAREEQSCILDPGPVLNTRVPPNFPPESWTLDLGSRTIFHMDFLA